MWNSWQEGPKQRKTTLKALLRSVVVLKTLLRAAMEKKRGKAEESGSKDLVKNNKKLGAKEGEEETEDLVKGNKGGEEMRNSNNDLAEISKLRDGPMSLGSVTNHAEWRWIMKSNMLIGRDNHYYVRRGGMEQD